MQKKKRKLKATYLEHRPNKNIRNIVKNRTQLREGH
jgi:hypothetical protein